MELKNKNLFPGQLVYVDRFQSALPGRLYNLKGRTDVAYFLMMHLGTSKFGIKLNLVTMRQLRVCFPMNVVQSTMDFSFSLTIMIMVC